MCNADQGNLGKREHRLENHIWSSIYKINIPSISLPFTICLSQPLTTPPVGRLSRALSGNGHQAQAMGELVAMSTNLS